MSKRSIYWSVLSGMLIAPTAALADGMLDFMDPCKDAQKDFKSSYNAIQTQADEAVVNMTAWGEDPTKVPDKVLDAYKVALRTIALKTWSDSPAGKGTIASWGNPGEEKVQEMFFQHIYPAEIKPDVETTLARQLFKMDYDQKIKPTLASDRAEISKKLDEQRAQLDASCKPDVVSQIFRGTIGNALVMLKGNFDAAKREPGELAKVVRAVTGISIGDIMKNGLAGGENSEMNKLRKNWTVALDNVGIGQNNEIRRALAAIDPTNLPSPKEVQVNIDKGTIPNLKKNLTFGLWK
ncbi:hypothetical protein [Agrobacterium sp. DE0009]|uniref:hypothetical protein n=1 Tax=Agrobacterium sp. DE0009 TaxID=2587505 RepID=UPI0011A599EB|nr:hypothetical protein [Agrobacterium sp. DE0009]